MFVFESAFSKQANCVIFKNHKMNVKNSTHLFENYNIGLFEITNKILILKFVGISLFIYFLTIITRIL